MFAFINIFTRFNSASNTPADDNLDNYFEAIVYLVEAVKPQARNGFGVPLCTSELVLEEKYNQYWTLISAIKAIDSSSGFYEGEDELLQCRHSSKPGL